MLLGTITLFQFHKTNPFFPHGKEVRRIDGVLRFSARWRPGAHSLIGWADPISPPCMCWVRLKHVCLCWLFGAHTEQSAVFSTNTLYINTADERQHAVLAAYLSPCVAHPRQAPTSPQDTRGIILPAIGSGEPHRLDSDSRPSLVCSASPWYPALEFLCPGVSLLLHGPWPPASCPQADCSLLGWRRLMLL